ncbi:MAG: alpha/beta hydrolase [Pseudomonadota bacterium]
MTPDTKAGFVHRYEPATEEGHTPLLLLHGTGGDENDLLPLGRMLSPHAALLSPRGRVLEHGMPRFFRRLAEGVFDHDDVRREADALAGFLAAAREGCGMPPPLAVGFSNGANIAAAVLYRRPEVLAGAVLMRAMVPLEEAPAQPLDGKPVLILSGNADTLMGQDNPARLAATLKAAGAEVEHRVLRAGHGLTQTDVALAKAWLAGK